MNVDSLQPAVTAAPQVEGEQREHSVDKGETLKVKIPFTGTGPFSFKLKKGNREIPDSDRVKLIPFEDYVVLQIKGTLLEAGLLYTVAHYHHGHIYPFSANNSTNML